MPMWKWKSLSHAQVFKTPWTIQPTKFSLGKESACNAGDSVSIPGLGKSWRRERLPTPVFWPREFHGLYNPWDCKESDTTEQLSLHLANVKFLAIKQKCHPPKYLMNRVSNASGHSNEPSLSFNFRNFLAVYLPTTNHLESHKILTKYLQVISYFSSPSHLIGI